ncbi:MAG: GTPase HflX [Pseudomonadota bacterium]
MASIEQRKKRQMVRRSGGRQRVLIVGIRHGKMSRRQMELSLSELARLVETSGGEVVGRASQEIRRIDPATYLGKGKVAELAETAAAVGADIVAVDGELSPVQNRNVEEELGVLVLDRTAVILDIFAMRAHSTEGKLQVELAQLSYLAPRLAGRGHTLSQQAGRIGTRGPGETALECDRRRMRDRITLLRRRLAEVVGRRDIQRQKREAVTIPLVSLVGYTNAGKSTLMNALTDAGVFVEDKLFATLDPTVRKLRLPSGREVLVADTVGFLRRLPHELVESFKSTFEEVAHAHLILHLIDGSDEEALPQAEVAMRVLADMGLERKPRIDVINKCDRPEVHYRGDADSICISALKKEGLSELLSRIDETLRAEFRRVTLKLPPDRGDILSDIYRLGHVWRVDYEDSGIMVDCELHHKQFGQYSKYAVQGKAPSP